MRPNFENETFNLEVLTAFDPAIIYRFAPEGSNKHEMKSIENLIYSTHQIQDLLNAYMHAQNEILPIIRTNTLDAITPQQLLGWLDELHGFIAQTLAVEEKVPAGSYSKQRVYRWNPTLGVHLALARFLLSKNSKQETISYLAENTNLKNFESKKLLKYLLKIQQDNSIEIDQNEEKNLPLDNQEYRKVKTTFSKLVTLHDNNRIDAEIKPILGKILKLCMPVEKYKGAMQEFAKTLLQKWAACENNDDTIAELCSFAYYNLTEIHPYFNANGRLATLLIEIILVSCNKSSIILRTQDDKDDPNSLYSQAFKHVDVDQKLLKKLFKARMNTVTHPDQIVADYVSTQVQVVKYILLIQKYYPQFDLNTHYKINLEKINSSATEEYSRSGNLKQIKLKGQQKLLHVFKDIYEKLQQQSKLQSGKSSSEPIDSNPKDVVLEKLKRLTGCTEGKIVNLKMSTVVLFYLNDLSKSDQLVATLNATGILKSEITITQTKKPILKIEILDATKLKELEALPSLQNEIIDCNNNNAGFIL